MNIIRKELKTGLKPFIFWLIGLFILVFAGTMKFEGISAAEGGGMTDMLSKFPRIVLAVFGMADVDITSLGGYYAVLFFFAIVCAALYACHLGWSAVARESVDKTYEFVFTKPISRSKILALKLIANWAYLALFALFSYLFSVFAISGLGLEIDFEIPPVLFSIALFIIGSLFLALSAFISATVRRTERGAAMCNLCFLAVFALGVAYDMSGVAALRFFTPLKYFLPQDILNNRLELGTCLLSVILCAVFLVAAFISFEKKDLNSNI